MSLIFEKILFSFMIMICFVVVTTQVFTMPTSETQLIINDEYIYMNGTFYGDIIPGASYDETTNEYVGNAKKASVYDTGKTAKYGDQLLTLFTCSYNTEDGRFVVVARKIE